MRILKWKYTITKTLNRIHTKLNFIIVNIYKMTKKLKQISKNDFKKWLLPDNIDNITISNNK